MTGLSIDQSLSQIVNASYTACKALAPADYPYCNNYTASVSANILQYVQQTPYTTFSTVGGIGFSQPTLIPHGWYGYQEGNNVYSSSLKMIIPNYADPTHPISRLAPSPPGYTTQRPNGAENNVMTVVPCGEGFWCPGGTEPLFCPDGTWSNSDTAKSISECAPCQDGYYCIQGTKLPPMNMAERKL